MKAPRLSNAEVKSWCRRHGITKIDSNAGISIAREVMEAKDYEHEQKGRERRRELRRELESSERDLDLIYGKRNLYSSSS